MATNKIPQYEIESIAKLVLPQIQKFFETEKGKDEFIKDKTKTTNC